MLEAKDNHLLEERQLRGEMLGLHKEKERMANRRVQVQVNAGLEKDADALQKAGCGSLVTWPQASGGIVVAGRRLGCWVDFADSVSAVAVRSPGHAVPGGHTGFDMVD